MTHMTGGEAVVQTLAANGVSTVFGIPGVHNLAIYDALLRNSDHIRHILARHEGGAGFMANGYARTAGIPGIVVVTTGPGAANVVCPLADAYRDSVPMLVIASQVQSDRISKDRGAFHEMHDQLGMAVGAAGWGKRVTSVEAIPDIVNAAWRRMTEGRPRPAYFEVPVDVLTATANVDVTAAPQPAPREADPDAILRAVELLKSARRPLVIAGGGAKWHGAHTHLRRLAEKLRAPVMVTCNGKGVMPDDHPLALGFAFPERTPYVELWRAADVLIAVGVAFTEMATADWTIPAPSRLIRIDVDPGQLERTPWPSLNLDGDAAAVLQQLLDGVANMAGRPPGRWCEQAQVLQQGHRKEAAGSDGLTLMTAISQVLGRDGISVGDAASIGVWQLLHVPAYQPGTFALPLGFGTLGFGLPAALGAQSARPDRRVVCLCGDGGFLFHAQELATAVMHKLNVVTVVVNDHAFGSIRRLQERLYDDRVIAAELHNPDLVRFAESFGAVGLRVAHVDEAADALEAAFNSGKPAVIEVPGPIAAPRNA